MICFRNQLHISLEHLLWTHLTFGLLIDVWWGSWHKGNDIDRHLSMYYLSLISPIILYIIAVLHFPPLIGDNFLDLRKHFSRIRTKNYLAFLALFISFQFGAFYFQDSPGMDSLYNIVAIALTVAGCMSTHRLVHYLILAAGWIMLLTHIFAQPPPEITQVTIRNFSMTEYLTVFVAFIYGFIASRFLSGWGVMITRMDRLSISAEHVAWTMLAFMLLLDMWIGSWLRESYLSISILHFMISLGMPLAFYCLSVVIFPQIRTGESADMKQYFQSNRKIIILMFGLVLLSNALISNLMEEERWTSIENGFRVIALVLSVIALSTRSRAIERSMLAGGWITMIVQAIVATA